MHCTPKVASSPISWLSCCGHSCCTRSSAPWNLAPFFRASTKKTSGSAAFAPRAPAFRKAAKTRKASGMAAMVFFFGTRHSTSGPRQPPSLRNSLSAPTRWMPSSFFARSPLFKALEAFLYSACRAFMAALAAFSSGVRPMPLDWGDMLRRRISVPHFMPPGALQPAGRKPPAPLLRIRLCAWTRLGRTPSFYEDSAPDQSRLRRERSGKS
eukprot:scaffold1090_cov265-Pinguiococcus_pyrenoidosus.AAC.37